MNKASLLVIRPDDPFSAWLRGKGFHVSNLQLIATRPLTDDSRLREVLSRIDHYDGIFFTSPAAAEVFVSEADRNLNRSKLYAMGGRARKVLERAGYVIESHGGANTAAQFVNSFQENEFKGKKLLFIRGNRSLLTIPTLLRDKAEVEEVVAYKTVEVMPDRTQIEQINGQLGGSGFDWICFFSPSGVESFIKLFGRVQTSKVAVIGSTTAGAAQQFGLQPHFVSPRSSAKEFAKALAEHIDGN